MRLSLLLLLFALAQAADLGTTLISLQHGCFEFNPLLRGSITHLVTFKMAGTVFIGAGAWAFAVKGYTLQARMILWVGTVAGGAAAGWNTYIVPWC